MSDEKIHIDYYKQAFLKFHIELNNMGMLRQLYLYERRIFWKQIPHGVYKYEQAIPILEKYSKQIENKIKEIVSKKSFLYWIHVYRRIAPEEPINGATKNEIMHTRRIMEISFQKYGMQKFCSHIARSKKIEISKIFNGLLLTPDYSLERKMVEQAPDMLVLTDFTVMELKEIYDLEKLCYEINLINKAIRIIGKGCLLNYQKDINWYNFSSTDALDKLMTIYDKRSNDNGINSSYLGVYYANYVKEKTENYCFFPIYNVGDNSFDLFKELFHSLYDMEFTCLINDSPNFIFHGFDIKSYYLSHKEASKSFYETNKISFEAILVVIYFFFSAIFSKFDKPEFLLNYLFRGYSINSKTDILSLLDKNKKQISEKIGISDVSISRNDFDEAISYLTFTDTKKSLLDLNYCSLYYPFYEVENNLLIDFSWIFTTFLTLFFRLKMNDQNFKGTILENVIATEDSIIPTSKITALDETSHQIDYSFMKDDVLYILECKVVSMSLDYERGVKKAVEYRTADVVERALDEVDIKAKWLIEHKEILNKYAPSAKYIVPIGVSAFIEYIPSFDKKYWLNDEIPRVLLPKEVELLKQEGTNILYNKIPMKKSTLVQSENTLIF